MFGPQDPAILLCIMCLIIPWEPNSQRRCLVCIQDSVLAALPSDCTPACSRKDVPRPLEFSAFQGHFEVETSRLSVDIDICAGRCSLACCCRSHRQPCQNRWIMIKRYTKLNQITINKQQIHGPPKNTHSSAVFALWPWRDGRCGSERATRRTRQIGWLV